MGSRREPKPEGHGSPDANRHAVIGGAAGEGKLAAGSCQSCRRARVSSIACSDQARSEHAIDSLFGRIFYGEPASTSPENAPGAQEHVALPQRAMFTFC